MGIVVTQRERIRQLERENAQLRRKTEKSEATLEYVAMMTDVDIEEEDDNAQQNV